MLVLIAGARGREPAQHGRGLVCVDGEDHGAEHRPTGEAPAALSYTSGATCTKHLIPLSHINE